MIADYAARPAPLVDLDDAGRSLTRLATSLPVDTWRVVADHASGLLALIVLDSTALGPAAGGIRTRPFANPAEALHECAGLARAMTLKCALAGLDAGGGKAVVFDHQGLDRPPAFAALGRAIAELDGRFRTAGDLGTTAADLMSVASVTRHVRTDAANLCDAVALGLVHCVNACMQVREATTAGRTAFALDGLVVAIQGCGAIGAAVARALHRAGCRLLLADVDPGRVGALATELNGEVVAPASILTSPCDILAPCAMGGVVDESTADSIRAFAVCGAANNILRDSAAEWRLLTRGVVFVPDPIASAGAVIEGVGEAIMGLADRRPLIEALGQTAHEVLTQARANKQLASEVAIRRAEARIRSAT